MTPTATGRWRKVTDGQVEYYELTPVPRITLQFYTRRGGVSSSPYDSLNLSSDVGDEDDRVEENARIVRRTADLPAIITLRQIHSDGVIVIPGASLPSPTTEGDAIVTAQPGIGMGIRVADCLPIYLYSRDGRCAGIAHCGWRGTVAQVARKAADTMIRRLSAAASDIGFSLGPCICHGCYAVGEDVRRQFESAFPESAPFFTERRSDDGQPRYGLDLRAANRWLLNDAGMKEDDQLGLCSMEAPDQLYSVRRNRATGRNLALIAVRTKF